MSNKRKENGAIILSILILVSFLPLNSLKAGCCMTTKSPDGRCIYVMGDYVCGCIGMPIGYNCSQCGEPVESLN